MDIIDQPDSQNNSKSRSIEDVLQNGYQFRFGDYLGDMFNLLKPTWAHLLGQTVLLFAGLLIVELIIVAVFIGGAVATLDPESIEADPTSFIGKILWAYCIIGLVLAAFYVPMRAGIQVFLRNGEVKKAYNFGDFFEVFRTRWLKVLGVALLIFILSYMWMAIPMYLMFQDMGTMMSSAINNPDYVPNPFAMFSHMGWMFLAYIPMLYFLISFSLAIPLILFKTDSIGKALEASLKIVNRKFFHFLAMYFLVLILTYAGVLACGVGLLITFNFFPMIIWVIYRDIFGTGTSTESTTNI